jgi:hypothetical protein
VIGQELPLGADGPMHAPTASGPGGEIDVEPISRKTWRFAAALQIGSQDHHRGSSTPSWRLSSTRPFGVICTARDPFERLNQPEAQMTRMNSTPSGPAR